MEDEYVKKTMLNYRTSDGLNYRVKDGQGGYENYRVTLLENFTAAVKASEALNKNQKKQLTEFIGDNRDIVKDGLERWAEDSDRVSQAHSYLQETFPNLPELSDMAGALIDIFLTITLPL
ncbi:conserved protein of unknown function [Shewanella benthica]|uniref:Uncharacterized protein n=1 Tax=Shewanella benthica TaxID=43661 RepID=A0A330M5T9_9GAMM|nr:hypothetical protein [Shewanella benthica]SQH77641.1 conserved protein of unknown function [Shewanella benthica]